MPDLALGFWVSLAVLAAVAAYAWRHRREGWGIPAMAVCGTVFAWYHGDVLYNDFSEYSRQFSADVMNAAWMQVTLFLAGFAWLSPALNRMLNRRLIGRTSTVVGLLSRRDTLVRLQRPLQAAFGVLASVWIGLGLIALLRTDFDWQGIFAPGWAV